MNILELKKSIDSGNFKNLYIFTGEEYTILEAYIKMICNKMNVASKSCESASIVYNNLNSKSLFEFGKQLYIIRDDKEFITSESMWNDLEKKLKAKNITVIFKYSFIDNRSKFAKKFVESIIVFEKLSETVLSKYIKKDINIKQEYVNYLISICNKDYGRILLEIDKIKNAKSFYNLSDDDTFKLCVNSHAFYIEPEGEVYDLVDSIMTRNYREIYSLLEESKRRNDNQLLVISLLHNNVKAVLQIQTCGTEDKELSKNTGLTPFQIKNAMKYVNRYTCEELVRFMRYLKYCEKGVKNGLFSQDFIIDYLLVNIL